jgi:RNA polymerase sigma-70 factor, ECF subfamily
MPMCALTCGETLSAMNATRSTATCSPGCAGLCTAAGMAEVAALYRSRMLARAQRIVIDRHLSEEAVQEAMLNAWRRCASYDPAKGSLANWLLTITANAAVDLVKARNRRPPLTAVAADQTAAEPTAGSIGAVDLFLLRTELRDALAAISPDHRRTVVAAMLDERPYAEVAAELGVAPVTVRTRLHYALRKMRTVLEAADAMPTAA